MHSFSQKLLLCFLFVSCGCQAVPPEQLHTFQEAQSAFDAGNFPQSAALYKTLLDDGVYSGTLYYNLGNAWAKAEEPVRAVAAYYFAKRYIPNDPHLDANLRAVLLNNGGALPLPERSPISAIFFWQDLLGCNVKIWCSFLLAALTFLAGMFCLFWRAKWLRRCMMGGIVLSAIALASVGYDWYRFEYTERIIVTASVLPRKGNSEQYEPAFVSPIPFGTLAIILDERSGWYSLRFPSGQEGWLPQSQTFRLE